MMQNLSKNEYVAYLLNGENNRRETFIAECAKYLRTIGINLKVDDDELLVLYVLNNHPDFIYEFLEL